MADTILQTKLNGLNIGKSLPAFLRYIPMEQIPDPAYIGSGEPPMVDMFETDEEWVKFKLEEYFFIGVQRGEDLLRKDGAAPKLTRDDIFVKK